MKHLLLITFLASSFAGMGQGKDSLKLSTGDIMIMLDSSIHTSTGVEVSGYTFANDSIGTRFSEYDHQKVSAKGVDAIHMNFEGGIIQVMFFNGYVFDEKVWYQGKLISHEVHKKIIKQFGIK